MTHAAINVHVVAQMTTLAKYMYIKVATHHVYESRCFYGFDDSHYCNTRGEHSGRSCPHLDWLCVLFAAVLSVFLKSSHFVQGLPTQRYYDLGFGQNKKLCRIWSRHNEENRCLTLSHRWSYNHYQVGWRMSIFILVRPWSLFILLNRRKW